MSSDNQEQPQSWEGEDKRISLARREGSTARASKAGLVYVSNEAGIVHRSSKARIVYISSEAEAVRDLARH